MRRGNGMAKDAELVAHDPHCYVRVDLYNVPVEACQCCKSIAKVRKDEREAAVERVYSHCAHTKHSRSAPCIHDEIAAAVRGQS